MEETFGTGIIFLSFHVIKKEKTESTMKFCYHCTALLEHMIWTNEGVSLGSDADGFS